jgi:hypothetical protein
MQLFQEGIFRRCVNHPEREASGLCTRCRSAICQECCTKVEGINYCKRCLEREASGAGRGDERGAAGGRRFSASAGVVVVLAAVWAIAAAMAHILRALDSGQ